MWEKTVLLRIMKYNMYRFYSFYKENKIRTNINQLRNYNGKYIKENHTNEFLLIGSNNISYGNG